MHPMIVRGLLKVENEIHEQLMEAYELFDSRNKGVIDASGLGEAMKMLGYEVDKKQVQEMLSSLGEESKGVITKEEFKRFMTARLDFRDDPQELRQAFDFYDSLKKDRVTVRQLEKMAEEIGEDASECPMMMSEADKDQDGFINWEEFSRCIKKTSYY